MCTSQMSFMEFSAFIRAKHSAHTDAEGPVWVVCRQRLIITKNSLGGISFVTFAFRCG